MGAVLAGTGRSELEELADRFLAERAVSVVADRALEERRWSTPDLLAVEQRLVVGATDRTEEHTASPPIRRCVTATCDRLLLDLVKDREQLDARTVLVVDEAGMEGSRKLARLLDHAEQAGAKVVLVGEDRQLASIDAGGGFRALRLRLGASGRRGRRPGP